MWPCRAGTGRVPEPLCRGTPVERNYGTRCGTWWRFSPRVTRRVVWFGFLRADEPRFFLARTRHRTARGLRVRRCFRFSRSAVACRSRCRTSPIALDSLRRMRGSRFGSKDVGVLRSCREDRNENSRPDFGKQEAGTDTRLEASARVDARRRESHSFRCRKANCHCEAAWHACGGSLCRRTIRARQRASAARYPASKIFAVRSRNVFRSWSAARHTAHEAVEAP